jgi:hypothetical protein
MTKHFPNAFAAPSAAAKVEDMIAAIMAQAVKAERRPHAGTWTLPPQDKSKLRGVQLATLQAMTGQDQWTFTDLLNAVELPNGKVPSSGNLSAVLRELRALGYSDVTDPNSTRKLHFITEAGRAALAEQAPADADA